MTSSKLLSILKDFVPEYHHAKFGGNWITNKGKTAYMVPLPAYMVPLPAYMVPKGPSLIRVNINKHQMNIIYNCAKGESMPLLA